MKVAVGARRELLCEVFAMEVVRSVDNDLWVIDHPFRDGPLVLPVDD